MDAGHDAAAEKPALDLEYDDEVMPNLHVLEEAETSHNFVFR